MDINPTVILKIYFEFEQRYGGCSGKKIFTGTTCIFVTFFNVVYVIPLTIQTYSDTLPRSPTTSYVSFIIAPCQTL